MFKWPMWGHFKHLHFNTFPMTPRTPQCEVFCPLLSNSKHLGVSEDSKSPTLGVGVSSSHFTQSAVETHLDICNTSYGKKKGRESNWQFNFWPLKVGNRPDHDACGWSVTCYWKVFNENYNFTSDFNPIRGVSK